MLILGPLRGKFTRALKNSEQPASFAVGGFPKTFEIVRMANASWKPGVVRIFLKRCSSREFLLPLSLSLVFPVSRLFIKCKHVIPLFAAFHKEFPPFLCLSTSAGKACAPRQLHRIDRVFSFLSGLTEPWLLYLHACSLQKLRIIPGNWNHRRHGFLGA